MKDKIYKIRLAIAIVIIILSILAVTGVFYPVKILDTQFASLTQRVIYSFSYGAVALVLILAIITLIFGRLYCSLLCPFGIIQEIAALIYKKKNTFQENKPQKYFIAAMFFGMLVGGSVYFSKYIDPYTIFSSAINLSIAGIVAAIIVLALVFYKNRFFCTNICPVGTILGLLSKLSINKIYINKEECLSCGLCAKECPSGSIDSQNKTIDNETCVKCLKCIETCSKKAIKYGKEPKESSKINIKRRDLIITASALTLFGAAVKAGMEKAEAFSKKFKGFIIPPGAENEKRIISKCLNCNLCVANCPNKIIQKADKSFPVVHIDYTKGDKFCKFDCNECSKSCPSGAINKISLEEKQKTQIALAAIDPGNCQKCGICSYDCPVGAITYQENQVPEVNALKCIGCGRCKVSCPHSAIEIFDVNIQRML